MLLRHIIFLLCYIYFLWEDIRKKEIPKISLVLYAIIAFITLWLTREQINNERFFDILLSVAFGLVIYMLSYFSGEGIGLADGMFFVISGLLLSLKENLLLFLSGLFIAFMIGVFLFLFNKNKDRDNWTMPFIPCFLPAIIGYIICTL